MIYSPFCCTTFSHLSVCGKVPLSKNLGVWRRRTGATNFQQLDRNQMFSHQAVLKEAKKMIIRAIGWIWHQFRIELCQFLTDYQGSVGLALS